MPSPHEFMLAAPTLDDDKLEAMVRASMLERPIGTRQLWLRELELALDGYGGAKNGAVAERIRSAIRQVGEKLGVG